MYIEKKSLLIKKYFGKINEQYIDIYTLTNENAAKVKITNYGAAVVSLFVPDRNGSFADVVTGYDSLSDYVKGKSFFGCIVGRYGNRIGKGKFQLEEKEYQLGINDGENHLHGAAAGFDKVIWNVEAVDSSKEPSLKLSYISPDGEGGYPGTLELSVTYTLSNQNELIIYYEGKTDKPTVLNPTHHSYFNLTGDFTKTILDHELKIEADKFTMLDKGRIPTGELTNVENTPMDFRNYTQIGLHINDDYDQLKFAKGYDGNWVLNKYDSTLHEAASLYDNASGRFMQVLTDQPGMQFYSGNFLNGVKGKDGIIYQCRTALCLEAQHFPDSPNRPEFPSVILKPGEVYSQTTIYKFSVK